MTTTTDRFDLAVEELEDLDAPFDWGDFLIGVGVGVGIGILAT